MSWKIFKNENLIFPDLSEELIFYWIILLSYAMPVILEFYEHYHMKFILIEAR